MFPKSIVKGSLFTIERCGDFQTVTTDNWTWIYNKKKYYPSWESGVEAMKVYVIEKQVRKENTFTIKEI